jgi:phosphatidylglycerol:prolipoprotein diacylglycerol transferase
MHSVLIDFGFIEIRSFGFCMAVGILTSFFLMSWLGKRKGYTTDFLSNFVLVLMISAFIGARFAYVCEHWTAEFKNNPLEAFNIIKGGIMYYGGLLGAWLGGSIYLLVAKRSVIDVLDLTVTVLPLGHAWGRVGCFLNGCCFGKVTDCAIGVKYPYHSNVWWAQYYDGLISKVDRLSLPVIPSQLIEAALNLTICIILVITYRSKLNRRGMQMGLYAVMYSAVRFYTETLRSDERMNIGQFSISQAISIAIMIFGVSMLTWSLTKGKKQA